MGCVYGEKYTSKRSIVALVCITPIDFVCAGRCLLCVCQKGYDDLQTIVPTCQQQSEFAMATQKISKVTVLQKSELCQAMPRHIIHKNKNMCFITVLQFLFSCITMFPL